MKNKTTTYKWAYLPFVFSSAAILATQATAGPSGSQQYQDAKQVNSINHEYVGGNNSIGFGVDDEGNVDINADFGVSSSDDHRTGVGLWAGYDLEGDDKGILGRGGQVNHAWTSKDASGRVTRVNKTFAAYDRNEAGHAKATVGYGQENEHLFWDGRVSKGLSGNKNTVNGVSERAYDWGVGATVGKYLPDANARIRAGIDHEWSNKVGAGEKDARNTTLSAGIEKFFQGTGHSISADIAGSKNSGGRRYNGLDDTDVTGRLGYKFDFGGSSIYQPDRRYRRVRVEVPGQAVAPRYAQKQQYKKVPTYKNVPVYGNKATRTPTRQLVKSTMELEGQTFFKLNSSKLIPSAQTRLKQIAAQIRKTGYKGSIRITGNTCGLGDARYDQILSEKRAKEVRNFLIKNGFNPNHLIARGLGKGHPKYPRTPDQDFKNRRVDIEYVSQQQVAKTGYKTENKRVQTGTRRVATGFKNVPAGMKNVMISNGRPGAPRVIWKTEAIPTSPAWIKRALNNNIKHNTSVNTYSTTYGNGSNLGPVANNDTSKTQCGSPVSINVLGNDTDADNDALTITSFTQPANGTVTRGSNGELIYTPNSADACGTDDSFTYTISDGNGGVDTATVVVSVEAGVKAANDSATTPAGEAVTIDVLANDDADAEITRIITQPSNGTAVISGGQVIYTPEDGFVGTDSFVYEVRDPEGNLATATATITVTAPVNTAPVAVNDSESTGFNTAISISVLDNDTDPENDALTITSFTQGAQGGTVTQGANGQLIYTPQDGFSGTDTFTYTISDGNGGTDTATVTVNVGGAVDTSVNAENDVRTTDKDTPITINVLSNDDSDATIVPGSLSTPTNGGTVSIVNGQVLYTPAAGYVGTDTFTYQVTDAAGNVDTATVTVTITETDTSVNAEDDSKTTDKDAPITIDVLDNDDSDATIVPGSLSTPTNGGTVSIVNGQVLYTPLAGYVGTDTFMYQVTDAAGNVDTATVTVTILETDKTVNADNDSDTTDKNTPVTINVLGNDDTDATIVPGSLSTPTNGGTVSIVNGQVRYTPATDYVGTDTFTYQVTDAAGNLDTATVTVTILETDKTVNADNDSDTTDKNTPVTINVLGNDDTDATIVPGSLSTPTNGGTVSIVNGQVRYTPATDYVGTDTFTYQVTDAAGNLDTATVTVTVEDTNVKPVAMDDSATTACSAITIDVLDNDKDADGDALRLLSVDADSLLYGTVMQSGNQIIYKPNNTCGKGIIGVDNFSYTIISDINGDTDSANVTVTVEGIKDGGSSIQAQMDTEIINSGETIILHVLRNDKGNGLKVIGVAYAANGTTSYTDSTVTYTATGSGTYTETFGYDIIDENGYLDYATIIIDVVDGCVKGTKCN